MDSLQWNACGDRGYNRHGGIEELALWVGKPFDQHPATVGNGSMVALIAKSWRQVDDFHAAALAP